jgi:hypothetical protein
MPLGFSRLSRIRPLAYFFAGLLAALPLLAVAQATFNTSGIVAGQPISAAQVKANFDYLKAQVDSLKTQVDGVSAKVNGHRHSLPGTWVDVPRTTGGGNTTWEVTAACPAGTTLTGGGCRIAEDASGFISRSLQYPVGSWTCGVRSPTGDVLNFAAFAHCASVGALQ